MSDYLSQISRSSQREFLESQMSDDRESLLDLKQLELEKEEVDRQIMQHLTLNQQLKEDIESIKEDIKKLDETCEAYDLKKDDQEIAELKREIEELKERDSFLSQELVRKEEILRHKTEEEAKLQEETMKLLKIIEEKKNQLQHLEEEVSIHNRELEKDLETARMKESELAHLTELLEIQESALKKQEEDYELEVRNVKEKESEKQRVLEEKEAKLKELAALMELERRERERYQEISRVLAQREEEVQLKKQSLLNKKAELDEDIFSRSNAIEEQSAKMKKWNDASPQRSSITMFESPKSKTQRSFLSTKENSADHDSKKHDLMQRIKEAQTNKKDYEEKQTEEIIKNSIAKESDLTTQFKGLLVCLVGFCFGILIYRLYLLGF